MAVTEPQTAVVSRLLLVHTTKNDITHTHRDRERERYIHIDGEIHAESSVVATFLMQFHVSRMPH